VSVPDVSCRTDGDVAIVSIDHPPVNCLPQRLRAALVEAFRQAATDPAVQAIVLHGAGRGFCAGGDIREFGTAAAAAAPQLSRDVHPVIETSPKPTVAALHGFAVGGGLETAMVCNYRIAAADTRIGLPELKHGRIPLSGTQRLPRVLGLEAAIELILTGHLCEARNFAGTPLFDQVVEGDARAVLDAAVATARRRAGDGRPLPLIRHRRVPDLDPGSLLAAARCRLASDDEFRHRALDAIEASFEAVDFDAGMAIARAIHDRLAAQPAPAD